MTRSVPCLAVTMGDPAGVGPEIIVKACRRLVPRLQAGALRLLVIGHRSALERARDLLGEDLAFPDALPGPGAPALAFLAAGAEQGRMPVGEIVAEAGPVRLSGGGARGGAGAGRARWTRSSPRRSTRRRSTSPATNMPATPTCWRR